MNDIYRRNSTDVRSTFFRRLGATLARRHVGARQGESDSSVLKGVTDVFSAADSATGISSVFGPVRANVYANTNRTENELNIEPNDVGLVSS